MAVTVRHLSQDPTATVVRGLDNAAAITHLCRSLKADIGFEDPIVVLDLRRKPAVAVECASTLREATLALRRTQRWLAVVDGIHHLDDTDDPPTFLTIRAAIESGQRYFRMVTGVQPPLIEVRVLAEAGYQVASAVVATAVRPLRAAVRLLAALTRRGRQ